MKPKNDDYLTIFKDDLDKYEAMMRILVTLSEASLKFFIAKIGQHFLGQ